MAGIRVTHSIAPGGGAQSGGAGLEHTAVVTITSAELQALRDTAQRVVPTVGGKLIVVKKVIYSAIQNGPGYTVPTDANFRLLYGGGGPPIHNADADFMSTGTGEVVRVFNVGDHNGQKSSHAVDVTVNGGTGELSGGSGGMEVRVIYDLVDLPN